MAELPLNQAVSSTLWEQLFQAAPVGLLFFDASKRLTAANLSARTAFASIGCELEPGWSTEHDLAAFVGARAAEEIAGMVEAALRDEGRQAKTVRVERETVDRLLSVCSRAVCDERGLIGVVLSMEDVTAGSEMLLGQVAELHDRVDDLIQRGTDSAATLESTRALLAEMEGTATRARTVLRFMRCAASAGTRVEAQQAACDALANVARLPFASVIDVDYESKAMTYVAANDGLVAELADVTVDWSPRSVQPGPGARAVSSGRPVVIDDVFADASLTHYYDFYRAHGLHAGAIFPVRAGGEIVSLLAIATGTSPLDDNSVTMAEETAEELGHVIERLGPQPRLETVDGVVRDLPIVFYDTDMDGHAGWISSNVESVTGYSVERFLREPAFWPARVHPEDRDAALTIAPSMSDGEVWQVPLRWQCADGRYARFLSIGAAETRPDGSRHGIGAWILLDEAVELESAPTERFEADGAATERLVRQQNELLAEQARLIEMSHDALFVRTWDGVITTWTKGAQRMYGWTADEAVGKRAEDLLHTEYPIPVSELQASLEHNGVWQGRLTQRTRDGSRIVVDSYRVLQRTTDGEHRSVLVGETDTTAIAEAQRTSDELRDELTSRVTELGQYDTEIRVLGEMAELMQNCPTAEEAHQVVRHYLPRLCSGVTGGAVYTYGSSRDAVSRVESWDSAQTCSEGFPSSQCWGLRRSRPHVVTDLKADLGCAHAACHTEPYICVPLIAQGEVTGLLHVCIDESTAGSPERTNHTLLLVRSAADQLALTLSNLRLRDRLADMSIQDPLSGLYNRRFMEASLDRELGAAERAETKVSVIMIDLDHFKDYNDTYGHDVGDGVIEALGILLRRKVRPSDLPCRYGGEEFLIVLPGAGAEIAAQRAEMLRDAIATSRLAPHGVPGLTASFGVAEYPGNARTTTRLLHAADTALYEAKNAGRNRVCTSREVAEERRRDANSRSGRDATRETGAAGHPSDDPASDV